MNKVNVNPNVPMSMDDFARIYLGGAGDPHANASSLLFNAPTAARSYMEDQWSNMGIKQAPEDYFATVANRSQQAIQSPLQNGQPAAVTASTQWPSFANDNERQLALANGSYDPSYPTPLARTLAVTQEKANNLGSYQTAALAAKDAPINPTYDASGKLTNPADIVRGQLAGDTTGAITGVLRHLNGDPTDTIIPPNLRRPLQPYIPATGYGSTNQNATIDKLDRTLYHDPEFQKVLADDPDRANFVYQRLTGRDMNKDIASSQDLQKDQLKTGFDFAKNAIAQGAQFDPATKSWHVWNQTMPDSSQSIGLSDPKAARTLVPATPQQNQWLNQHYSNVMGGQLPRQTIVPPSTKFAIDQAQQDPLVKTELDNRAKILGRPLTAHEQLDSMKAAAFHAAGAVKPHSFMYQGIAEGRNAMFGLANQDGVDPDERFQQDLMSGSNQPIPDEHLNALGKLLRSFNTQTTQSSADADAARMATQRQSGYAGF